MLLPASGTNPGDRLDAGDIHLAVAGLPPEQRAIIYLRPWPEIVKAQELASLTDHLWRHLMAFEAKRRPKPPENPTPAERKVYAAADRARSARQAAMVRTALAEFQDNRLCHTCYRSREPGKVMVQIEGKGMVWETCSKCGGTGWRAWSDNRRARSIGGDRNAYTTRIAPGYEHVLRECSTLHREGITTFKARLFGSEDPLMDEIVSLLQARV
jgi:hypothetical protein